MLYGRISSRFWKSWFHSWNLHSGHLIFCITSSIDKASGAINGASLYLFFLCMRRQRFSSFIRLRTPSSTPLPACMGWNAEPEVSGYGAAVLNW
jgi:hypothetical protein